ncbi:Druantia anti-phage system protein DruA [Sorangium sp. So ce1024]|uniref:Druantia anti-phage system protein DruA n=1 Tax=Sorangium sp. So ce1024 TaxID=3133327 RepID=UPI003F0950C6
MQRQYQSVLNLARALEAGDAEAIAVWDDDLERATGTHEVLVETTPPAVSPSSRAKVLGSVLIDLARSGWSVSVEEGQVYVAAPEWRLDAKGMSPEDVRAEKDRARAAMAGRVQEEIESERTRRFILRVESARAAEHGLRSVLSLIADGASVAAALRARGAAAIQPVLCPADLDAGRDPETGLLYADIFRYFRLFWSFPTSAPPGRSLSYLIRDAGQPGSPVCGLLCVASPVPKLSVRDSALGWTAAWLEAVVVALDFPADAPEEHLRAVADAWRAAPEHGPHTLSILADVAALLGFPEARSAEALSACLRRLTPLQRAQRADGARRRVLADLRREIEEALDLISFSGFGFAQDWALENPAKARARLEGLKEEAYRRWHESQPAARAQGAPSQRLDRSALADDVAMRDASREPLFFKKRVTQGAKALRAWEEIAPRGRERPAERLRQIALGRAEPSSLALTGGARVSRSARFALLQRQNRLVASQILDVCVCGAIPPYGPLLGGKLAALAALSRDVAADYHARYARRASEITSQMAGQAYTRPADLLAMTTTSFYGVGSSQYERLSVRSEDGVDVRWRLVGRSRGNGTLHFSSRTSKLIDEMLCVETGRRLITSRFGEGPSERLRKIRDGLDRLGIDADELLRHGMPRLVYLAELRPGATRPGARATTSAWRREGPSWESVAQAWRDRWLKARLHGRPDIIDEVARFSRVEALLSNRLRARRGGTR